MRPSAARTENPDSADRNRVQVQQNRKQSRSTNLTPSAKARRSLCVHRTREYFGKVESVFSHELIEPAMGPNRMVASNNERIQPASQALARHFFDREASKAPPSLRCGDAEPQPIRAWKRRARPARQISTSEQDPPKACHAKRDDCKRFAPGKFRLARLRVVEAPIAADVPSR